MRQWLVVHVSRQQNAVQLAYQSMCTLQLSTVLHKYLYSALYAHFFDASGFLSWETGTAMWLPLRLYPWCRHRRCLVCMPMLTSRTTPVPPRPCGAIWYAACKCATMPCLCLMNCIMQLQSCCRVDAVEHAKLSLRSVEQQYAKATCRYQPSVPMHSSKHCECNAEDCWTEAFIVYSGRWICNHVWEPLAQA